MPNQEDLARASSSSAAAQKAATENQTNKIKTQGQITLIEQAINSLPGPVSVAAKALGEGIYAGFKTPISGVSNPSANQDPMKLLAFAIAFAILKAIWCFIKSLLNPLPFIGSFFPLCKKDPQLEPSQNLTGETLRLTNKAKSEADSDQFNISAEKAQNLFEKSISANTANAFKEQAIRTSSQNISATESAQSSDMNDGSNGITFEEFVARNARPASNPNLDNRDVATGLQGQINRNTTSANIPEQPVTDTQWQPTDDLTERTSYEAYRRLFGL